MLALPLSRSLPVRPDQRLGGTGGQSFARLSPPLLGFLLIIFFLYKGLWLGLVWLRADFHRMSCGRSCGRDVGQKSKGYEKRRKREDERDFQVLACLAHPLWLRCPFPLPPRFFGMMDGFVADAVLDDVWTVRRMSHGKSTEEITGPGRR